MQIDRAFLTGSAILLAVSGCAKHEPRSKQYSDAHLDEARVIVSGCRDGSARGDECANADAAVQEAEVIERGRRFFGK
mgnify:CR=1 FL=1